MVHPKQIEALIEEKFPKKFKASWDNPGWQIYFDKKVSKVLLALDVINSTVETAINEGADLIITHHPLFFKPLNQLNFDKRENLPLLKLLENKISVYTVHTNLDVAKGGINDYLAELLELTEVIPLTEEVEEQLYKIAVFVPESHWEMVRDAMGSAGAGHIGNYSHCTFNTWGTGTFLPLEGTNPYLGTIGKLEKAKEVKIETIASEKQLNRVVKAMLKAHPYEEVAYDIYPLKNKQSLGGMGRIGITKKTNFEEFIKFVAERLKIKDFRYGGNLAAPIKKVAVLSGSGGSYWTLAKFFGADVFVTGDVKYHEALSMVEAGLNFIDAGHFETEAFFYKLIAPLLDELEIRWSVEKRQPVFKYLENNEVTGD